MSKKRVLLLLHVANGSGAPRLAAQAFAQMQDAFELRTLTLYSGELETRLRELGQVQNVKYLTLLAEAGGPPRKVAGAGWALFSRSLSLWKPDCIYVNSVAALPIARNLRLPSVPMLMHVHETGTLLDYHTVRHREFFRTQPSLYIGVSQSVCKALTETHGIPAEKVGLVNGFVCPGDFPSAVAPRSNDGPLVVGGAGSPNWYKGTDLWLQTAAILRDRLGVANIRFVWVGMNSREESFQFRAMARKLGVEPLVEFVDSTPNPYAEYARFDVFAMTSWEESFSLVALENMMLGKPVVCFAGSGGPPEVVGEAGIVVPEFAPEAMAAEIARLAANPELRAQLGANARERACREFTDTVQIPKLRAELERLTQH